MGWVWIMLWPALSAVAGVPAGIWLGCHVTRQRDSPAPLPAQPVPAEDPRCGCGHHLSYHDPKTKTCSVQVQQGSEWVGGAMTKFTWVTCRCRQFVSKNGNAARAPAALPETGVTPAKLARVMGYDPDYTMFLEWLQHREKKDND